MEFFYGIWCLVVKKNQIRRAALADASRLLHPVQLRRIQAHFLKQSQIINVTSFYQPGNRQWQGGFQPDDAARRLGQRFCLLLGAVRCMIRRNHINRAVLDCLNQRLAIRGTPQRRIHFRQCSVLQNRRLVQCKMMRCHLRPDMRAQLFRQPDHLHRIAGTDVLDIHICARMKRDHAVARHHRILRQRRGTADSQLLGHRTAVDAVVENKCRILLMEAERHIEAFRRLHRLFDQFFAHQRDSVIRKSDRTRLFEGVHIGQFFSLKSL